LPTRRIFSKPNILRALAQSYYDADLIGCPVRVTVGEKNLKEGMVELKPRKEKENRLVRIDKIVEEIKM